MSRSKKLPEHNEIIYFIGGLLLMLSIFSLMQFVHNKQKAIPYQNKGVTAQWIPSTVTHWDNQINEMAKKYNIDPNFIAIIMTLESGGDAQAKSPDNAQGLMQITPNTAKDISTKFLKKPVASYNLYDPRTNIEFGAAYLSYLRDQFGTAKQGPSWNESVELVAAGYNGGPLASNHLEQGKGLQDPQTVIYSRDTFNMWRERNSGSSPTFDRWRERGGKDLIQAAKISQERN